MDRHSVEPTVSSLPGSRAKEWVERHTHFAPTTTYVYDFVWDITEEAIGPFCTDVDGNVLMDFTCHVAAAPLGYNNPKIMEKAREFDFVDPLKIAGNDFYVAGGWPPENPDLPGPTQLLDRLADLGGDYGFDTAFLSNSGAEAVENAIKICYANGGHRAVTFEGAFHGRTLGALSLNRSKRPHRKGYPEIPGVISAPYCTCEDECRCGWHTDGPGGNVIADRLETNQGHLEPSEIAFLIIEPVQGEGGYRMPSERFLDDIVRLQDRFDISIIADEIQSGLGRTGELWAVDHTPIDPDVMCAAKGLRVGATMAAEETFPDEKGRISSTWGAGDVIDSLYGVVTIDAILENDLMENAVERGDQLRSHFEDSHLDSVVDVRNKGLMFAVEFDSKDRRESVVEKALQRGVLTLGCGYKTLRILPPLDVTPREIDLGAERIIDAIRAAE